MKRLALVAAVLAIAACQTREADTNRDTAALAPAPAMSDSAAQMDSMMKDSTARDSAARDTTRGTTRP